jgi:urease accessory protein
LLAQEFLLQACFCSCITSYDTKMKSLITKRIASRSSIVLLAVLLLPAIAAAHPIKGVGDFYAGMLHPLTALDLLLPWIALALFAGQQGKKGALLVLNIFPAAILLGAVLALGFHQPVWLSDANLAIIPLLGLAVALAFRCPGSLIVVFSATVGLLQGLANGVEITGEISPWRFIPGLATVAVLLVAYGVGIVRSLEKPWTRIAVRVAGSWIAAIGIMICAFKF